MKLLRRSILAIIAGVFLGRVSAETSGPQDAPPLSFFAAGYEVIGKNTMTGNTYSGTIIMSEQGDKLKVQRNINGNVVMGEAEIVRVIEDIPALKVTFTDNGKKMVATYQINGDWENYARLTGTLEIDGKPRTYAGLEALFYGENLTPPKMNENLTDQIANAEKEQTRYYEAVKKQLANDPKTWAKVQKSQKTWRQYRDEECGAIYQHWIDGSIRNEMYNRCSLKSIKSRTRNLWEAYLTYMDSTPPVLPEPTIEGK